MKNLNNYSVPEKQAYAAKCLAAFCNHFNIFDDTIDELIIHLTKMKDASNLLEWNRQGTLLKLTGRGDPLPQDLEKKINTEILQDFKEIVDFTVEIGIVDLFSAESELPDVFFLKVLSILDKFKIRRPIN